MCFADFSKAFDLINRTILFYKLMNSGCKGRVIDTFRSLYWKTYFRVKRNGKSSPPLLNKPVGWCLENVCETCVTTGQNNFALWYQRTLWPTSYGAVTLSYSQTLLMGFRDNSLAFKSCVRANRLLWMKPKRNLCVLVPLINLLFISIGDWSNKSGDTNICAPSYPTRRELNKIFFTCDLAALWID